MSEQGPKLFIITCLCLCLVGTRHDIVLKCIFHLLRLITIVITNIIIINTSSLLYRDDHVYFQSSQNQSEEKASRVLGVVFSTFVICWAPFFIMNLILGGSYFYTWVFSSTMAVINILFQLFVAPPAVRPLPGRKRLDQI